MKSSQRVALYVGSLCLLGSLRPVDASPRKVCVSFVRVVVEQS